jgi:hypothetical protein
MDLILKILQFAETNADGGQTRCVPSTNDLPDFDEIEDKDIQYHIGLCHQAGFLEVERTTKVVPNTVIPWYRIIHLTWEGHEYLTS